MIVVLELNVGLTVISIVICAAHKPALAIGVKVYVVVPAESVEIIAGLQVPFIPLSEVFGNCGGVEFSHKGPICAKLGGSCEVINISIVVLVPH